jgi:hypothetical protein
MGKCIFVVGYISDPLWFSFESGNGIQREEKGFLKNPSSKNPAQVMSGSWSYTGPDGKVMTSLGIVLVFTVVHNT